MLWRTVVLEPAHVANAKGSCPNAGCSFYKHRRMVTCTCPKTPEVLCTMPLQGRQAVAKCALTRVLWAWESSSAPCGWGWSCPNPPLPAGAWSRGPPRPVSTAHTVSVLIHWQATPGAMGSGLTQVLGKYNPTGVHQNPTIMLTSHAELHVLLCAAVALR